MHMNARCTLRSKLTNNTGHVVGFADNMDETGCCCTKLDAFITGMMLETL
jgi:hypothetical protein